MLLILSTFHLPPASVDTALANIGQPRLPLDHSLFEFGSWMGGDRCGSRRAVFNFLCLAAEGTHAVST
jgi:hypothetical protein